jgi:hypothetical protein
VNFSAINMRSGMEKDERARIYGQVKECTRFDLTFCCLQKVRGRGVWEVN